MLTRSSLRIALVLAVFCFVFIFIANNALADHLGPECPGYSPDESGLCDCACGNDATTQGDRSVLVEEIVDVFCAPSMEVCDTSCGDFCSVSGYLYSGIWFNPDTCLVDLQLGECDSELADNWLKEMYGTDDKYAREPVVILEVPFGGIGGGGSGGPIIGLAGYILVVYEYIVVLVALAAAMMIVWGGFKWTTSAGNSSQIASAKSTITNAIIGLVLALTSYVLLATINPALVNLDKLKIPKVIAKYSGCDGVAQLMDQGKVDIKKDIDKAFIRGTADKRPGTATWCYGGNGGCSGPPSDNRGKVTMNPKVCEVIVAAQKELEGLGVAAPQVIVSSIIGSHSKCAGSAPCAGPTPECTACLGPPNQSPHWEGRGVDIGYSNLTTEQIEQMNLAICQNVQGLSQIISRPSKDPAGDLWEGGGCGPNGNATKHHDHTHITIQK